VKIAFVGKGGSGKTTLASLFAAHLAASGRPLLAIDADVNQHLATALGATEDEAACLPALGDHLRLIEDHLRGHRLLRVVEDNPVYAACVRDVGGVRLAVTGRCADHDLGVACYHSKVGVVELLLGHLLDGPEEYVVVDMTAGADASGLFTRFDLTFLVCEPTVHSVGVYRQYSGYAREFGVRLAVVGNKVADADDFSFLRHQVGADLVASMRSSAYVRAAERGEHRPIDQLEPVNRTTLAAMRATVDSVPRAPVRRPSAVDGLA
jgi:CO dehydrogenase maturation factor